MEPETQQTIEKHYGKEIAIAIIGALVVVGIVFGAFYGGGAVKTTYTVPQTEEAPVIATTTPLATQSRTETFVITDTTNVSAKPTGTVDSKTLKSPVNFKSFTYDATVGKTISVSGTCNDSYYALLIFESKDDYRANPGAARSNRAFECGSTRLFTIKMDLRDINLPSGDYYLFVADQGDKGSWYNPR